MPADLPPPSSARISSDTIMYPPTQRLQAGLSAGIWAQCGEVSAISTPTPTRPTPTMSAGWPSAGRIEYREVSAIYREGLPPVLRHLTFTVEVRCIPVAHSCVREHGGQLGAALWVVSTAGVERGMVVACCGQCHHQTLNLKLEH